jgi:hypothetical protein
MFSHYRFRVCSNLLNRTRDLFDRRSILQENRVMKDEGGFIRASGLGELASPAETTAGMTQVQGPKTGIQGDSLRAHGLHEQVARHASEKGRIILEAEFVIAGRGVRDRVLKRLQPLTQASD